MVLWRPTRPFRTNTPKQCHFHYRGLECKSRKSGDTWKICNFKFVTGKFVLQVQKEAGQRLIEFFQENALVIANTLFQHTREDSIHGRLQMANSEIRLILFFAAKNGEALYSQEKQDRELTVAQIMKFLLPNSGLNWRKWGKPLDHSVQFSSVVQYCLTLCHPWIAARQASLSIANS